MRNRDYASWDLGQMHMGRSGECLGIPLRASSKTTFNKIARKYGEHVFMDDSNSANKYSLRICVKTTFFHLIAESLKVIIKGKVYMVRAKEVTGWVSDFGEENSDESEDYSDNNSVGKKNWVESEEGEIIPESVQNDAFIDNIAESEPINRDSRENQSAHEMNDSNPKFPSGFTPQHSDHYEYEKVEVLRESTTPQDSKKVLGWVTMQICCLFLFILLKNDPSKGSFGITCWRPLIVGMVRSLLWEILMRGYSFTWSDKHASKMSKLDRFFVSQGLLDLFPNLRGLILHRHHSDHRPILLKETHVDYGPTPFRLYHPWFLEDDFHSIIEDSWNNNGISASNSMILLKNKLKFLKQRLKEWSSIKRRNKDHDIKVIQDSLIDIDLCLDKGNCLPDDLTKCANLFRDLKDIDHKDSIDLAQKAKIKWAIEGDENSKFFHGIVNKKRRYLAIKDILVNGEWIENPNRIRSEFYSYYSNLFSAPAWDRSLFDVNFPRRLNSDQIFDLEDMVSNEEIKRAVWDCGSDKSPGLDGFTFEFFKKFWTIVGGDVTNAIKEFFISSSFPKGSFIKGRQILDGPLILNEVISWCKARKEQLLMFKVDFQKAFDSVRWDHLDDILGKFGFGIKWRGWICGCLQSSKDSVLVNGSPTDEFSFHRGARQGDPLSPFLFILV
nr:RNA-directed DNA polymerase, eukaryota [Tanacetum cinerariifolium]